MKKILTATVVVLMMALVCVSCKDKESSYPSKVTAGAWSGGSASTGWACEVYFTTDNTPGGRGAYITLINPDVTSDAMNFYGMFSYNAQTGTITIPLNGADGAPTAATFQFNSDGDMLEGSFTATFPFGNYTLYPVTYPKSLAGYWYEANSDGSHKAALELSPKAVNGGLPCDVEIPDPLQPTSTLVYRGFYTYDAAKGTGTVNVKFNAQDTDHIGTFKYNADHTVSLVITDLNVNTTHMELLTQDQD